MVSARPCSEEHTPVLPDDIADTVATALAEDVGDGDRSAAAALEDQQTRARLTVKEAGVLAGCAWFDEVFRQLDDKLRIDWQMTDGAELKAQACVCVLTGSARTILTGERTALNFLQLLSGVATSTRRLVDRVKGTRAVVLDTRKTLPGLRAAQKYAVCCGGGVNHRSGLYDGILIKENHIAVAGSVTAAVERVRAAHPDMPVQVEVENLHELDEALINEVSSVLLDNFPTHILSRAVKMCPKPTRYSKFEVLSEASGNIDLKSIRGVADTGVDRISVGGLTKHVTAIDFSLRIDPQQS
ncbi:MAG: carboxylating nicotinate-nucleotide diphosphorylase [Salinisphaera sp.]|nr:carboxylating nicotinate-nucleotide diphosphorylase [Salinisphaera sp.]